MSCSPMPQRTAVAELLLVSPIALNRLDLSSSRRRRITPTAEATSPRRVAIITRPGVITPSLNSIDRSRFPHPLGWSSRAEVAHIDQRVSLYKATTVPNSLHQNMATHDPQEPPPARHLIFSFDLREKFDPSSDPEKRDILWNIFPGTIGIGSDGWFVYLQLRTLPPKPWPLTVAGVPLYLHLKLGQNPLPPARPVSWKNGSIAEDQDGKYMKDWKPLFLAIKDHFQDLRIPITEVMYLGNVVVIVLKHRDTDTDTLPCRAAKIGCNYLFEDEMGRPSALHASRLTDPAPGNPDVSQYDTLQPGLRVASSYLPSSSATFMSTTTGVLLRDGVGNEFMTVAAHGFPSQCGTQVFHAFPGIGRDVGELVMEVSHTDIALVKLKDTEKFSNITFESDRIPEPIQLKQLAPTASCPRFSLVCLDSPDTGFIEGQFMWSSFQAIPSDDESAEQDWVFTTWSYMGQDAAMKFPEEMCGSSIWSEDGNVLGFFRYAPKEGLMKDWCVGLAADELINRGYTLVNTRDRT
ncbi:hypothetical protein A1O7_08806 [Cladophialophora yegresii CBS 114405]|uniref:Uncharacterized protein n=1 Tax=Cladophialophora yegresii CBS 114405 TaxID=1182544 RepID=W9VSB7_9EURO|nr:uncharacterized protein A1O7_08806 [Cladophialophora yegresii CBS 114405]EXJ55875.1 hypothetical protein A1O7_08806 [Cladophialophora yegresii CBS 114405]